MEEWVLLTIFSSFVFEVQGFLYNVAMKKKIDKYSIVFYYSLTVSILSALVVLYKNII